MKPGKTVVEETCSDQEGGSGGREDEWKWLQRSNLEESSPQDVLGACDGRRAHWSPRLFRAFPHP